MRRRFGSDYFMRAFMHIPNPLRYAPPPDSSDDDDDCDLLIAARDMLTGEGRIDWFLWIYDAYKEGCRKRSESGECKRRYPEYVMEKNSVVYG